MASDTEVRRYFAESGRQSELDRLGLDAARKLYESRQVTQPTGMPSVTSQAQELYKLGTQFRQPAIETLKSGQAGLTEAYGGLKTAAAAQKPTIEQRYKDTLAEITKTTRGAATAEFTRRGIPLSSGLVEQTVGAQLGPQIQQAATQRDVNLLGVQQLLTDIGIGEAGAQQDVLNTITQIQGLPASEAISGALGMYQTREQSRQADLSRAIEQAQLGLQQQQLGLAQQQTEWEQPWQEKLWQYELNKPYYKPETEETGMTAEDFIKMFGGGIATTPEGTLTASGVVIPKSFIPD